MQVHEEKSNGGVEKRGICFLLLPLLPTQPHASRVSLPLTVGAHSADHTLSTRPAAKYFT